MGDNGSRSVRVACVGAGYWGKNLVRNFHALGALRVICDNAAEARGAFAESYPDVALRDDVGAVLADPTIDGVVIATPAETHGELIRRSLEAGKHVYVEKPLCLDVDEGAALVRLAAERRVILMVGHLLHYHPVVVKLKAMIADGTLGRLQYIYSNRLNLGKIRTEENILWSFAPHDISLLLALVGQIPDNVASFGSHFLTNKIADVTVSAFTFPSGVSAHIFVSWLHPFKEQKLVVVGDRGMAVFDDVEKDDKLLLYPHSVRWQAGMPIPDKKEALRISCESGEPLAAECRAFIEAVHTGVPPFTDGAEGLQTLKVLAACQASMEKGGVGVDPRVGGGGRRAWRAHETAVIDEGAVIGAGTSVWHFSHVMPEAVIGENCNIGQNVFVGRGVRIGANTKIQNNVSVYEGVTLEENVFCGPSMVFTNVNTPRSGVDRRQAYEPTLVKKGATIGANATVVCGHTIGAWATVAAGAVVTADVADHALVIGVPARRVGWMCHCGARLDDSLACGECGGGYVEEGESIVRSS